MFIPYADNKNVAIHFAEYKINDTVILIDDIETQNGLFEKGTKMIIKDIKFDSENTYVPCRLPKTQLNRYRVNTDNIFTYQLETSKSSETGTVWLNSYLFEKPDKIPDDMEQYRFEKRKKHRKFMASYVLRVMSALLIMLIISLALPMFLVETLFPQIMVSNESEFIVKFTIIGLMAAILFVIEFYVVKNKTSILNKGCINCKTHPEKEKHL